MIIEACGANPKIQKAISRLGASPTSTSLRKVVELLKAYQEAPIRPCPKSLTALSEEQRSYLVNMFPEEIWALPDEYFDTLVGKTTGTYLCFPNNKSGLKVHCSKDAVPTIEVQGESSSRPVIDGDKVQLGLNVYAWRAADSKFVLEAPSYSPPATSLFGGLSSLIRNAYNKVFMPSGPQSRRARLFTTLMVLKGRIAKGCFWVRNRARELFGGNWKGPDLLPYLNCITTWRSWRDKLYPDRPHETKANSCVAKFITQEKEIMCGPKYASSDDSSGKAFCKRLEAFIVNDDNWIDLGNDRDICDCRVFIINEVLNPCCQKVYVRGYRSFQDRFPKRFRGL